jgi:hypothetical protein
MQFLVRVDGPRDALAFEQSMRDGGLSFRGVARDHEWAEPGDAGGLVDAALFVVEASNADAIDKAVREISGYASWPNGEPVFKVLRQREDPTTQR